LIGKIICCYNPLTMAFFAAVYTGPRWSWGSDPLLLAAGAFSGYSLWW